MQRLREDQRFKFLAKTNKTDTSLKKKFSLHKQISNYVLIRCDKSDIKICYCSISSSLVS